MFRRDGNHILKEYVEVLRPIRVTLHECPCVRVCVGPSIQKCIDVHDDVVLITYIHTYIHTYIYSFENLYIYTCIVEIANIYIHI